MLAFHFVSWHKKENKGYSFWTLKLRNKKNQSSSPTVFLLVLLIYQDTFVMLISLFFLFPLPRYAPCKVLLMGSVHAGTTSHGGRVCASESLIFYWITELRVLSTFIPPSAVSTSVKNSGSGVTEGMAIKSVWMIGGLEGGSCVMKAASMSLFTSVNCFFG